MGGRSSKHAEAPDAGSNYNCLDACDIFKMICQGEEQEIIKRAKDNPDILSTPLSFEIYVDSSSMIDGLPVTCQCGPELEQCLANDNASHFEKIHMFYQNLENGQCEHLEQRKGTENVRCRLPKDNEHKPLSPLNDSAGVYPLHLAVIMDKNKVICELLPFFLEKENMYSVWFTLHKRFSLLHLALVHKRDEILSIIVSILEKVDKGNIFYFISETDMNTAVEVDDVNVFDMFAKKTNLYAFSMKVCEIREAAFSSRAYKCLESINKNLGMLDDFHKVLTRQLDEAIEAGDAKLIAVIIEKGKQYLRADDSIREKVDIYFVNALMKNDHMTVGVLLKCQSLTSQLSSLRYRGYTMLRWALELDLEDVAKEITNSKLGFLAVGSKHSAWSTISSVMLFQNEHTLNHVATLIRKGHDVDKPQSDFSGATGGMCGTEHKVMLGETPFYVALGIQRFDLMKLLLLNGAQPLDERNATKFYRLIDSNVRGKVFHVLFNCNALEDISCQPKALFQFLLARVHIDKTILSRMAEPRPKPSVKDLVILMLESTDKISEQDERYLFQYVERELIFRVDDDIKQIVINLKQNVLSLKDICRFKLRRHFGRKFPLYIDYLRSQCLSDLVIDILLCSDIQKKCFGTDKFDSLRGFGMPRDDQLNNLLINLRLS